MPTSEDEVGRLREEVSLLRSVVRGLLRLLVSQGVGAEDADLTRDAARLVGETLRGED